MRVMAKQGLLCPRQDPRDPPIGGSEAVDVPETTYYRRRIADGSLIHAAHAQAAAGVKKVKEGVKE